jgi:hypothetical protein
VRRSGPSQGEALVTWALWAVVLAAIAVTYARLDPAELYHVSRDGLAGGLSRALVVANFPLSLVAIALCLVAVDALGRRAWWLAGPAIALCAVSAGPGVVDQADLDARLVNAVPALGVALALGLTLAATRAAGGSFAGPCGSTRSGSRSASSSWSSRSRGSRPSSVSSCPRASSSWSGPGSTPTAQ